MPDSVGFAVAFSIYLFFVGTDHAAVGYTDARIIDIEPSDQQIHVLSAGRAPPIPSGICWFGTVRNTL